MIGDRTRFGRWVGAVVARLSGDSLWPDSSRIPYTGRTSAGVGVNADTALKNAAVFACIRYLSQTLAVLPWHVMKSDAKGFGERVRSNPIDRLLSTRPNPEWSAFQFRETLMTWALLQGNGYAEIERDSAGRPFALWPIEPERVQPSRDQAGTLFYRVHNGTAPVADLDANNVFHLRGFGHGPVGINVVQYAAESIGWAQATEIFGSTFFGEGLNAGGIVEVVGSISPEAEVQMRDKLNSLHKGPRRAHRWAILDAGAKMQQIATAPNDAQFIETRQHQIEEIARWFGVPPHKIGHLLRATFSNIEHQAIEVVVDSVTPWATRFELEADYKLFGLNRQGFYSKLNLNGLMRGDAKSRGEFYKLMREIGAFSANDILRLEDRNPIGSDGDKYVMQSQYTTLARIGEEPAPKPPAAPIASLIEDNSEAAAAARMTADHLEALLDV
jgi:HK97 family phage portal protein